MENLISLLRNENPTKEELVSAMGQIKFCTTFPIQENQDLDVEERTKNSMDQQKDKIKDKLTTQSISEFNNSKSHLKSTNKMRNNTKTYSRNKCISTAVLFATNDLTSYTDLKKELVEVPKEISPIYKSFQQQDFWNRYEAYQTRKKINQRNRVTQIKEQEAKECSFKPKLNIQPIVLKRFSSKKSAERLHSEAKKQETIQKLRAQVREKELVDIEKNCTFRPTINSSSVDSRYMESSNNLLRNDSLRTGEMGCTFSPKINQIRKLTEQYIEYLSINPYTRLSSRRNEDKMKAYESMKEQKKSDPIIIKEKLNDFHARQLEFEQKKLKNKEILFNATQINPKPKINKKSEEIAKGSGKQRHKITSGYNLNNKKENEGNFTFRPEILLESRNRQGKTLDEMTYIPTLLKERKLNRIRESIKQQEEASMAIPPKPNKEKYPNVQSKLKILDCIDTLMERIERERFNNKNFRNFKKKLKENQEMRECTHKPNIKKGKAAKSNPTKA